MTELNFSKKRPLSPHLQIYRWPITMVTSIAHRATGIVLSVGTIFITIWLCALAYSEPLFNYIDSWTNNIVIKIALFLYSYALILHLLGGIRHLFWDVSPELLEKYKASKMAYATIYLSIIFTIIVWGFAYLIR